MVLLSFDDGVLFTVHALNIIFESLLLLDVAHFLFKTFFCMLFLILYHTIKLLMMIVIKLLVWNSIIDVLFDREVVGVAARFEFETFINLVGLRVVATWIWLNQIRVILNFQLICFQLGRLMQIRLCYFYEAECERVRFFRKNIHIRIHKLFVNHFFALVINGVNGID